MHSRYDRIVWTVIALALAVIALNPWIAPDALHAQSRTMDVNIKVNGFSVRPSNPLPVKVVE